MSKWINVNPEDVGLSIDKESIEIYLHSDKDGAVYLDVPINIIKQLLEGIKP